MLGCRWRCTVDVNISKRNLIGIIILIIVGTVLFVVTSSKDYQTALYQTQQEINAPAQQKFMQDIHNKVVSDAVTQYGIARRNGTPMDVCVQAGLVSAAYLQAQDETGYKRAKETEKADCARAGLQQ